MPWIRPDALEEQKALLTASQYARLHLNVWTAAEDRLVSVENLDACVRLDGPLEPKPGQRYVCGLDLGLKNDRSVAAICHREGDEVVLDRMAVWQGTPSHPVDLRLVEEWVTEAARRYNAEVICDPWQATGLLQRLKASGIKASEYIFSAQSVGRLAVTLHTAIRDHRFALPNDEELLDELANVRLKETSPNVYRMDHDPDRHDDRAVALALCALHLLERPASGGWCRAYGREACAQCGKVYALTEPNCPGCGNETPQIDETPNQWLAVVRKTKGRRRPRASQGDVVRVRSTQFARRRFFGGCVRRRPAAGLDDRGAPDRLGVSGSSSPHSGARGGHNGEQHLQLRRPLAHANEDSIAYAERYVRKALKREDKRSRKAIAAQLEAVQFYAGPETPKKKAKVRELTKVATNPYEHPHRRQVALDELRTVTSKSAFTRAVMSR